MSDEFDRDEDTLQQNSIAKDVMRFVSYALPARKKAEAALHDIRSLKGVRKAVQEGKNAQEELKAGSEFKERIKNLFNGYELTSSEELLFRFTEKYVKNGDKMAMQTRKWLIEACDLKKEGKDYSALQKKIRDGITLIKAKGIEHIGKYAAQNDNFIANMCKGDSENFIRHWPDAQNIINVYRTVLTGPDKAAVNPELLEHFNSILKNESVLNERRVFFLPTR